ncbi:MAG TPA: SoxR reducing system RseC family protein [Bacteroidales bacterium]|jgi:sigma-E factor negative regulatory protein RseC|nr:SoxR reducing system RseC family protein [Bacteroidales bacterium]
MKAAGEEVIDHEGVVASNSGTSVIISISSQSACSGCHAKGSCNMFGTEEKTVEVKGNYNVSPGDTVNVLMSRSMGFTALALGYILPFMVVLLMLITLVSLKVPELTAGLISLGALLPYYLILYLFRERLSEKFVFTLKV